MRSLSGPPIWAIFLHVLTSHLLKLTLTAAVGSTHGADYRVGVCVGKVHSAGGGCGSVVGDLSVGHSQQLLGGLFDGVHDTVSRICVPLMPFLGSCQPFSQPLPCMTLVIQLKIQYSGWGKREVSFLCLIFRFVKFIVIYHCSLFIFICQIVFQSEHRTAMYLFILLSGSIWAVSRSGLLLIVL